MVETKNLRAGIVQKNINVETNDENNRNFVLTLKANLITYLEIMPEYLNINVVKGEEGRVSANISSKKYPNFKILKVSLDNPKIKYELSNPKDEKEKLEKGYIFTIISPPDLEPNTYSGKINIITDINEQPEAEFYYNVNIMDIITVNPQNISLNVYDKILKVTALEDIPVYESDSPQAPVVGTLFKGQDGFFEEMAGEFAKVRVGQNLRGYIKLDKTKKTYSGSTISISVQKHKEGSFEINKIETDLPFIKTEYKKVQENYYIITLTYEGEIKKANYTANLTIYTNDKEKPVIKKPFIVNVGIESPVLNRSQRILPFDKNIEIKKLPQKPEEIK